ncbi:hypothetical protein M8332_04770 [Fructilactobacillus ixorae]|uniref:Transcriptional regulator n=1 Tax=Fructilactobacillus ixorae TaxID=1750535 RepID=A0ABY5C6K2_9LACO|nr:hypothetical protein [Fructilactobacillus ixorae]USS92926.1 hypothetical protein M8332_04770 [Fructilactobacillus ixorae]
MEPTKEAFTAQLEQLQNGDLQELTVQPDQFFIFQQAFMDYPTRKRVVGTAQENGVVVYHYASAN